MRLGSLLRRRRAKGVRVAPYTDDEEELWLAVSSSYRVRATLRVAFSLAIGQVIAWIAMAFWTGQSFAGVVSSWQAFGLLASSPFFVWGAQSESKKAFRHSQRLRSAMCSPHDEPPRC